MSAGADISASTAGTVRPRTVKASVSAGDAAPAVSARQLPLYGGMVSRIESRRGSAVAVFVFTVVLLSGMTGGVADAAVRGGFGGDVGHGAQRGRPSGAQPFRGRAPTHFHRGPELFVVPYPYDFYYGVSPYDPDYVPYCDAYSPYYNPQYCYWGDGS